MENKELTEIILEFAKTCNCDKVEYLGNYKGCPVYEGINTFFKSGGGYRGLRFLLSFDKNRQPRVIPPDETYTVLGVVTKNGAITNQ